MARGASQYGLAVPAADWSGPTTQRSLVSGLVQNPGTMYSDPQLSWTITENSGVYTYTYVFEGFKAQGFGLSHFVMDITDDAVGDGVLLDPDALVTSLINGQAPGQIEYTNGSFPQEPGITGAFKIGNFVEDDDGNYTFSFTSNRGPVWGHFRIKAGSTGSLNNAAYGSSDAIVLSNTVNFIARPNGSMPEPATAGLLALGSVLVARRRRPQDRILM